MKHFILLPLFFISSFTFCQNENDIKDIFFAINNNEVGKRIYLFRYPVFNPTLKELGIDYVDTTNSSYEYPKIEKETNNLGGCAIDINLKRSRETVFKESTLKYLESVTLINFPNIKDQLKTNPCWSSDYLVGLKLKFTNSLVRKFYQKTKIELSNIIFVNSDFAFIRMIKYERDKNPIEKIIIFKRESNKWIVIKEIYSC
ncbi:MAG TPA: hypothetical protein PK734_04025 [Bacteroidales bacterium]|nr:MAG: hypothetical protein BWY22_01715 [Bacteroidetes bacterium ADurb.Bin217]HPM12640.1 hypothetical protein [Bacteroidales bacterium]